MGLKVEIPMIARLPKTLENKRFGSYETFFCYKIRKGVKLMKKFLMFAVLTSLMFTIGSFTSVSAAKKSVVVDVPDYVVIFEGTVEVDNSMTKFEVGFVTVTFKKNFLDEELYPITFDVEIYAENGLVYIEFNPSVEHFFKDVKIHASAYEGYIYDIATGENIYVEVPNQILKVEHFSRYCFAW